MGSGISTKYEKTYFYTPEMSDDCIVLSECATSYSVDTHTVEYSSDDRVVKLCDDMVVRPPDADSTYQRNLVRTSRDYELNGQGFFGKRSSQKVWTVEADDPIGSAMDFYSKISDGGATKYLENHHGIVSRLSDDVDTFFRPYPKSEGCPTVEIRINLERAIRKIHFIKR